MVICGQWNLILFAEGSGDSKFLTKYYFLFLNAFIVSNIIMKQSKIENFIDKTNLSSTNMTNQTGDDTFRSRTRTISKSKFSP